MSPSVVSRLSALLVAASAAGCDKTSLSNDLYAQARAAIHKGRSGVAANALRRALAYDPRDERARRALAALYIDAQRYQDALATLGATSDAAADEYVENLRVRAETGMRWLERATERARALHQRGALEPGTQTEIVTAVTRALARNEEAPLFEDLPPTWRREVIAKLLTADETDAAARLTVGLPKGDERDALRELVFERAQSEARLSPELLRALTEDPRSARSYRARLEALLVLGDVAAAHHLELQRPKLDEDAKVEWQLRWARHFASRSEWLSVLDHTRSEGGSPIDRATRHALRCSALLRLDRPLAARREIRHWLASPDIARHWHRALTVEELRHHQSELQELRWEVVPFEH